ncbi:Na+/H+ antiporter subunit E [Dethiosulfovibrio salsuginis]|uniref:Multicomponent Na+:H+ antiporter subunit E n=1 Tax=Dethiosulfovibrio salsuginis TaxID=561720 RepID=A0A1X7JKJ7_9BACT|nr:Na+/H+ antiporter subunit E [Dethiosulfovibrio salsuginis]SMG28670.1 multicomponent Na+:H+ antiporter subunit E [Dethiosulfovibrio salsuginis]
MFVFVLSFLMYLLLVWSGEPIPAFEYGIALIISTVLALSVRSRSNARHFGWSGLNPMRWLGFLYFMFGPFIVAMVKSNIDVAIRIITGNIKPGIVKVDTGLTGDMSKTLLANAITLTPGTLTVDVEEDSGVFYVHWINVTDKDPSGEAVYGSFGDWARRLAE